MIGATLEHIHALCLILKIMLLKSCRKYNCNITLLATVFIQITTIRQSLTQHLFYKQLYMCQSDMFRPSRPSSDPSTAQNQALFSFPALWGSQMLQVSVTGAKSI